MFKLSETDSPKPSGNFSVLTSPEFSFEQRRMLLSIAHDAILAAVEGRSFQEGAFSPWLSEKRGVFTTLYSQRQLRGCVGYAVPVLPLARAVAETARAAAFDDTRFMPVNRDDVCGLIVSLSVLSHLFPVDPERVEIGRHGLVISQGSRRGLLLPQVPVEHGWGREVFLEQACRKAGLPQEAWRNDASITIEAFTAEVFADGDGESDCR
jgi:AmmeMemoRadiSam system protein A